MRLPAFATGLTPALRLLVTCTDFMAPVWVGNVKRAEDVQQPATSSCLTAIALSVLERERLQSLTGKAP